MSVFLSLGELNERHVDSINGGFITIRKTGGNLLNEIFDYNRAVLNY